MVLFAVFFALDFKGAAGGSPIQFLMAGLNVATFLLLALSYRFTVPRHGLGAFASLRWGTFLLTCAVGALVNAVSFTHFIQIIYPFTLFLEGFLVASWTVWDPRSAKLIVSVMLATAIVLAGFTFTGNFTCQIPYDSIVPRS